MEKLNISYKTLQGVVDEVTYTQGEAAGKISFCRLNTCNKLQTPWGELIPAYDRTDTRAKYRPSICFFESGKIKSIYLQERSTIVTPVGEIEAELITFYEEGTIHRVFPLYGQISGYWSEEEEYGLATENSIQVGEMTIKGKISCYCFYPSGKIKSLSFWRQEIIDVTTPLGVLKGRLGLAFYEDGQLKSFEPEKPILLETSMGEIMAYDNAPIGIHGDTNSVVFNEAGELLKLKTIQSSIQVISNKDGCKYIFMPQLERDEIDPDQWRRHTLTIQFEGDYIEIDNNINVKRRFNKTEYQFRTVPKAIAMGVNGCTTCSECGKCHNNLVS